jgi:hypothetical protein
MKKKKTSGRRRKRTASDGRKKRRSRYPCPGDRSRYMVIQEHPRRYQHRRSRISPRARLHGRNPRELRNIAGSVPSRIQEDSPRYRSRGSPAIDGKAYKYF